MKKCKYCETEHNLRGYDCQVCKDGLHRYGMTRQDMIDLYESQGKVCRLCDISIKMFNGHKGGFIDHCHTTGKVRGILCNRCNTIVGGLEKHSDVSKLLEYIGV